MSENTSLQVLEDFNNSESTNAITLADGTELTEENAEEYYKQLVNKDKKSFPTLPILRIVHQAVDEDGNPVVDSKGNTVKAGSWNIKGTDLYQEKIKFIPIMDYFQIQRGYTDGNGKFTIDTTILFNNFKEELISTDGSLGCGRVNSNGEFLSSKLLANYDEEEANHIRKTSPVVVAQMGLAFFDESPEGIPVVFYLKKMNIKTVSDSFNQISNPEQRFFNFSTKRGKVGSVIYYSPVVEVDTKKRPEGKEFYAMAKARKYFEDYVKAFNNYVLRRYQQALQVKLSGPDNNDDTKEIEEIADDVLLSTKSKSKSKVRDVEYEEVELLDDDDDDNELPY